MKFKTLLIKAILLSIFMLSAIHGLHADDTGIHKARLIQQNDSTYIFEVDVGQKWLWAIKAPILPERFKVSEESYISRGTWYVVRVTIISTGAPLNAEDEMLLPWGRNGADLTAIWQDGSINKGLFIRDFNGIKVPMKQLLPFETSMVDIIKEHLSLSIKHFQFNYLLVLFTLGLFAFFKKELALKAVLMTSAGAAFAMLLSEWGFGGFDLIFCDLLLGASAIYLAYNSSKETVANKYHFGLSFALGTILGLGYFNELKALQLTNDEKIIALFVFGLVTFSVMAILVLILKSIWPKEDSKYQRSLSYITGGLGFAMLLMTILNEVANNDLDLLNLQESDYAKSYSMPLNETSQNAGSKPTGKPELTAPVMSYLSIEPYEVRHEILINARAAVQLLGVNDQGMFGIPVGSLIPIKEGIEEVLLNNSRLEIDGSDRKPEIVNTDFVTLSTAGVLIRDTPIPESLDEGILGITMIYETDKYPDQVNLQWNIISPYVRVIETTSVDPFGISTELFQDNATIMKWENTLMSTPNDNIQNIEVEARQIPYLSYLLLLGIIILIVLENKNGFKAPKKWPPLLFAVAIICFPFVRFSINLPFISQLAPSEERSEVIIEKLLTNVYKSFDVRNEEKVYDRLALSVTGDKLTEIYLDNRKSLEFENRGGARASIDKVIINNIEDIDRTEKNTYTAKTVWMVNGSVGHFGHTHYRRNWYNALITFTIVDDSWKIKDIELIEEKRIL